MAQVPLPTLFKMFGYEEFQRNEQDDCVERVDQETFGVRKIRTVDQAEMPHQSPCEPPAEAPRPAGLVWDAAQFLGKTAQFSCPIA